MNNHKLGIGDRVKHKEVYWEGQIVNLIDSVGIHFNLNVPHYYVVWDWQLTPANQGQRSQEMETLIEKI